MHRIDAYYINLATAHDRRARLEQSFRDSGFSSNWTLSRFEALTPASQQVMEREGTGCATEKVKANYLSHIECLRLSKQTDNHALIVEDDTIFCDKTEQLLNNVIASLPEDSWDLIFTDIYVSDALVMPKLLKTRDKCLKTGQIVITNAAAWEGSWGGAASYLVNRNAKDKIADLLDMDPLQNAYDMVVRHFVSHQALRAIIVYPFLTTISAEADKSLVRDAGADPAELILYHYFRKLVWIGAENNPESVAQMSAEIKELTDRWLTHRMKDEAVALGAILAPLMSCQMTWNDY